MGFVSYQEDSIDRISEGLAAMSRSRDWATRKSASTKLGSKARKFLNDYKKLQELIRQPMVQLLDKAVNLSSENEELRNKIGHLQFIYKETSENLKRRTIKYTAQQKKLSEVLGKMKKLECENRELIQERDGIKTELENAKLALASERNIRKQTEEDLVDIKNKLEVCLGNKLRSRIGKNQPNNSKKRTMALSDDFETLLPHFLTDEQGMRDKPHEFKSY